MDSRKCEIPSPPHRSLLLLSLSYSFQLQPLFSEVSATNQLNRHCYGWIKWLFPHLPYITVHFGGKVFELQEINLYVTLGTHFLSKVRVALPTHSFPQGTPSEIIVSPVFTWIFLLLTHRIKAGQLFCILAMFWAGIPWLEMMEWLKSREPISFLNLNLEKGKKKEAWAVRCSSQASEGNAEGDTGKPRGRCFLPPELDVSVFGTCSQMIYFYWISILLMSINWKKKSSRPR